MKTDLPGGLVHRSAMCEQLGITGRTARRWELAQYGPPARRMGGRVYYSQAEIEAFLRELAAPTAVNG